MNNKILAFGLLALIASGAHGGESSAGPPGPEGECLTEFTNSKTVIEARYELEKKGYNSLGDPGILAVGGQCANMGTWTACARDYLMVQSFAPAIANPGSIQSIAVVVARCQMDPKGVSLKASEETSFAAAYKELF